MKKEFEICTSTGFDTAMVLIKDQFCSGILGYTASDGCEEKSNKCKKYKITIEEVE
jgi:hypothetical protein